MQSLVELLKHIRKHHHLTQSQLAEQLFVSHQAVSNWELEKSQPSLPTLQLISDTFAIPITEIIKATSESTNTNDFKFLSPEKNRIIKAYISLLVKNDNQPTLLEVYSEAGLDELSVPEFASITDIFDHITSQIDHEVLTTMTITDNISDPFELIADTVLPILYQHNTTLKILYMGTYAHGKWIKFLEYEYTKWATQFLNSFQGQTTSVPRSFLTELIVKWTLSIVSTWLTQPLPDSPAQFKPIFLKLTKTAPHDLFTL